MNSPTYALKTTNSRLGLFMGLTVGLFLSTKASAQVTGDWAKHFRLGAVAALNLKADFTLQGNFGVPSRSPGAVGVPGVDHIYDDGYVRVDATGNAGGLTSFWGYQNASQYDAAGQRILFHSASSLQPADTSTYQRKNEAEFGMELAYGGILKLWRSTLIGWDVGFSYLPIGIKDSRDLSISLGRDGFYHATGAGFVIPAAPYNNGSSGVGTLIGGTAQAGPSDVVAGVLTGSREIDTTLYNFRLGPTFYWDLGHRFAVQAGLGGAVGFLNGSYRYNEIALTSDGGRTPLSGRLSQSDIVYGGYAQATLLWRTGEKADLYLSGQYMTLGDTTYGNGGRAARLDLRSGLYISIGINWPF